MSGNECDCDYLNVRVDMFAKYTEETAASEAINILPALFHQRRDFTKVIAIAALLPENDKLNEILKKNERELERFERDVTSIKESNTKRLDATIRAIEGSFSNVLTSEPYSQEERVIKFLAKYARNHGLGFDFWRSKLHDYLIKDTNNSPLLQINNWSAYSKRIMLLGKSFEIPENELKNILMSVIERSKREAPRECIKILDSIGMPVDYEVYLNIADDYIRIANKEDRESTRNSCVEFACNLYELIGKHSTIGSRHEILTAWKKDKDAKNCFECKGTLKAASRILEFKYIPHGIADKFGF